MGQEAVTLHHHVSSIGSLEDRWMQKDEKSTYYDKTCQKVVSKSPDGKSSLKLFKFDTFPEWGQDAGVACGRLCRLKVLRLGGVEVVDV